MAAEEIGNLIPTKIPGYADDADIQAALRVYHYGSYDYSPSNTSPASLVSPSMAKTIYDIQQDISALETGYVPNTIFTAKGQILTATASNSPVVLTVGSNNQFLIANSATASGLEWTNSLAAPSISTPTISGGITLSGSTTGSTVIQASSTAAGTITFPAVTGTVVTTGDTGTVTGTMIASDTIVNADINSAAAIAYSKLNLSNSIVNADINTSAAIDKTKISGTAITAADTGTVTSTMIADNTIVNGDISTTANIAVSKLAASTISGITLGNNLNALTISTGLSGTSYNGSAGVTIAIDSSVATTSGTQTLTNKTFTDSTTNFQDNTDTSKKMQFELSGITTATTRTLTVPNSSGTISLTSDLSSYAALSGATFTGAVLFPAATTSATSIRIPHGSAPTTPTNGDIWTTTAGIYVRVNGSTVGPLASAAGTLTNPMTTLGDTIYGGASGAGTRLAGNTSATRTFLGQTGDGTNSAAPSWTTSTGSGSVVLGTSPTISGGSITALTSLAVRDTSAAFDVTIAAVSSPILTAGRTLTLNLQNAARTISLAGNLTVSAAATVSGTNTGDQTITLTGDVTGSGTGSFATTLATVATAGTYKSVTINAKGLVTSGTNPTTLSGYGITDAAALAGATFTGSVLFPAATTSATSIRVPHGSAPTTPTNGDIWTTTAGLYARINGSTVGPFGTGTGNGTVTSISTGTGLSGGPITTTGTISLSAATPTVIGGLHGYTNTTVTNTALGYQALNANTTGTANVAIGFSTLDANTSGYSNTAIGSNSLGSNTTGNGNTAVGNNALLSNISGINNVAIGNGASYYVTSNNNTSVGSSALGLTSTGANNSAFGKDTLASNTTSSDNTAFGHSAIGAATGQQNTALGSNAGYSGTNNLTTGSNNILIGYNASASASTVSNEITLGNASITRFRIPGLSIDWTGNPFNSPTITTPIITMANTSPTFTTNNYDLVLSDQYKIILASNGSTAGTVKIPTNSIAYPTGTQITIVQTGTGQITITAGTPATTTISSTGATATSPKLRTQYSSATCIKTASEQWLVVGDIV